MEAVAASGAAEIVGIADPAAEVLRAASPIAPRAALGESLDDLLRLEPDGIVIATPSALHAEQAIAALERGIAVFCQKPLARTAEETAGVVAAARAADRLLAVDLSYRFTTAMRRVRELVRAGELGRIYAADLVFHNAYGPGKPWFYEPALAGGGCVMDLGIHLVDLSLWVLDFPTVEAVRSRLFVGGVPLGARRDVAEDFAVLELDLEGGAVVRIACSWRLPAGRDAVIAASFFGTDGGAAMHNVDGSFYDFAAERFRGTARETLATPPDAWGGRAVVEWAQRLARGARFDAEAERLVQVAEVLDRVYEVGLSQRGQGTNVR